MTTLPTWAYWTTTFGGPALTFVGVLWAQHIGRSGTRELEVRSRREEVMRNLRWAAELGVSEDDRQAKLGFSELTALARSDMLDPEQQLFIDAALEAISRDPVKEVEQASDPAGVVAVIGSPTHGEASIEGAAGVRWAPDSPDSEGGK